MKRVAFYYDFSCPYAYLGHTQIEALCAAAAAELTWMPMLLGGVFQAVGTANVPMRDMPSAKARLHQLDMQRWAEDFGVPLRAPATHPNRTVLALRASLASGDVPRASKALFAAYWVEGLDVSQREVVAGALTRAGFDGDLLVARTDDPTVKDELRRRTSDAVAAGVFGAPTFIVTAPGVDGDLFWGQDRLAFVQKALGGWSVKGLETS
jgi:2-hydroxychromene-2-carboxylate isomerase